MQEVEYILTYCSFFWFMRKLFFFFFKLEKSILLFFHPHKLNFGLWPQVMGNDIEVNFLPL